MAFDIRPVDPAELAAVAHLREAAYAPFVAGDGEYVAALRDVARRGVGTARLRRVVDESRRRGREGVVCSSQPAMRAAHRVYQRLGLRRVPERDWSPAPGVELHAFAIWF